MSGLACRNVGRSTIVVCVWWALVCILSGPTAAKAETYLIQTRVVVDHKAFWNFREVNYDATEKDMEERIRNMFVEVSEIYKNINGTNMTFQFEMTDFQVLQYYEQPPLTDLINLVNRYRVMNEFYDWLLNHKRSEYDIALLFTGFDIASSPEKRSTLGVAHTGHVCTRSGVGVIELNDKDVISTAHEIGHLLGAPHDGDANSGGNATACSGLVGHVMYWNIRIDLGKYFHFSECSAKIFRSQMERLDKKNINCLKDGPRTAVISGPLPGTTMNPDDICRKTFGGHSYFSRKFSPVDGDNLCATIHCYVGSPSDTFVRTPAGFRCGKNKQCIKGKCVVTSSGDPVMSDTCPYGERARPENDPGSCAKMPLEGKCWKEIYKMECCYSCNRDNPALNLTADDVCRTLYGKDAVLSRASYNNNNNHHNDNNNTIATSGSGYTAVCKKLHCVTGMDGESPVIRTHEMAPDGMPCGGKARCNNGLCVKPFTNLGPDSPKNCPYGDQPWVGDVTTTCQDAIQSNNGCPGLKGTCCQSCQGK